MNEGDLELPKLTDKAVSRRTIAAWSIAIILFLIIYILRLDDVVGLYVDDGWYVLLAKALATGNGYSLINSPSPGILPIYPPAFPWLLSIVYRLSPQFPQNTWLLKSVSIIAMLIVGVVAYRYFLNYRRAPAYLAFAISLATVLSPWLVFFATSTVMSECVFTMGQLATIAVIELCVKVGQARRGDLYAILGAAFASFSFLTRSVAAGLIVAVILYLLKERRMRLAMIFAMCVTALCAPWMIYARLNAPTPSERAEQNCYIVEGYDVQFWQKKAGDAASGAASFRDLPPRVLNNISDIIALDAAKLITPTLVDALQSNESGRLDESRIPGLLSFILSELAFIGFYFIARNRMTLAEIFIPISLTITVLWPFEPFRLLLPLTPFAIFYVLNGIQVIAQPLARLRINIALSINIAFIGALVGLSLFGNLNYIRHKYFDSQENRPRWIRIFEENAQILHWIDENLPAEAPIAAQNPPLVNLYTGRKTVSYNDPDRQWPLWNRLGIRHLVYNSINPIPEPDAAERKYNVLFTSSGRLNLRVVDLGPPTSRTAWGR